MTTTYDTFLPEVLPYAPNCAELVAINAIRNAVIEFCTCTWYWQHDCFEQAVVATIAEYTPDVPDNTKLVGMVDVWFGGKPLYPQNEATLRRMYGYTDYRNVQGSPRWFYSMDPNNVILVPCPDERAAAFDMTARVAVTPLRASTGCLTTLYERFAETIAQGALARLKATPGQPYSDPPGAQMLERLFRAKIVEVRAEVERNKSRGPMRVRFNGRTP
jgi:hypothetical protein